MAKGRRDDTVAQAGTPGRTRADSAGGSALESLNESRKEGRKRADERLADQMRLGLPMNGLSRTTWPGAGAGAGAGAGVEALAPRLAESTPEQHTRTWGSPWSQGTRNRL